MKAWPVGDLRSIYIVVTCQPYLGICSMALQFTLNREAAAAAAFDCVVVGAFADKSLTPAGQAVDEASGGRLRALLEPETRPEPTHA